MSAPHFFADDVGGEAVTLIGEEATHATRALRIRPGETITVGDGAGTVVVATVEDVGATVRAAVIQRRAVARPTPRLTVFPAVPKSGKLEVVVQKLTELGVDAIVPWFGARTVVRWDTAKRRAHGDRLRAVAREAAKQSRRAWLPEVADPVDDLGTLPAVTVVLHEDEHAVRLRDLLPAEVAAAADPVEANEVGLVIGPEGGLDPEEVVRLASAGARVAGLGDTVLRTETAAIVGAALVLARYGRLG